MLTVANQGIEDQDLDGESQEPPPSDKVGTSMKSVSRLLQKIGINLTWTSFHRMVQKRVEQRRLELSDVLGNIGLDSSATDQVAILVVPDVLDFDILQMLRCWAEGRAKQTYSHFFDDIPFDRKQVFRLVSKHLKRIASDIREGNGYNENVAYLQPIYERAVMALSSTQPSHMDIMTWVKTVNASHDSMVAMMPRIAWIYTSRQCCVHFGTVPFKNEGERIQFNEDSRRMLTALFNQAHLGPSAMARCDAAFSRYSNRFKRGQINAREVVANASRDVLCSLETWCEVAYDDHIAHGLVMNQNFVQYFQQSFGVDVVDKRIELAKIYKRF